MAMKNNLVMVNDNGWDEGGGRGDPIKLEYWFNHVPFNDRLKYNYYYSISRELCIVLFKVLRSLHDENGKSTPIMISNLYHNVIVVFHRYR